MRIIALNSSMRKGGNTEQIIRLIETQLREKAGLKGIALEYEYIPLGNLNLSLCRGCRVCFDRGENKCPLKDDLQDLYAKLLAVDGIILGSPVYAEDVNGVMKNFIDRMAFNNHRPSFAGKSALIVTTSGMGSTSHTGRTMKFALGAWGFHIADMAKFSMGALMKKEETEVKFSGDAKMLADKLFTAIEEQKPLRPSLFSLLVFKVQQKCYLRDTEYQDTYDHAWWKERGYLDKSVSFYMPHRANPVKPFLAKLLSVPIYKMFS